MRSQTFYKLSRLVILLFLVISTNANKVLAVDTSNLDQRLSDIKSKKLEYQNQINLLEQEQASLKNRIDYIDKNVDFINAEIEESKLEIEIKQSLLNNLKTSLTNLQNDILISDAELRSNSVFYNDNLKSYYMTHKLYEYYKNLKFVTDIDLIKNLYYFDRTSPEVLKALNDHTFALSRLNKVSDSTTKKLIELNGIETEIKLHYDLISSRTSELQNQKQIKLDLLSYTKNSEKSYKELLEKAEAEEKSIEDAINSYASDIDTNQFKQNVFITKGSVIGYQGSTGFVTGEHLHFSVYRKCDNAWCHTNPQDYLDNNTLIYPISNYKITQSYGVTDFAKSIGFYKNHLHNGIDFVGPHNTQIIASAEGYIKYVTDKYGAKGALIYHNNNLMTAYWHLK